MGKWNDQHYPACVCGFEGRTSNHIVAECPITKFRGGFSIIHQATPEMLDWLETLKPYDAYILYTTTTLNQFTFIYLIKLTLKTEGLPKSTTVNFKLSINVNKAANLYFYNYMTKKNSCEP